MGLELIIFNKSYDKHVSRLIFDVALGYIENEVC